MVPVFPRNRIYPKSATKATWEAAKTLADKTKKTGLAAKLKAAETAWNAIPMETLNIMKVKTDTAAQAKAARVKAVAGMTKVRPAFEALIAAIELAKKVNANTTLSKPAQRAAGVAYAALLPLYGTFNEFGTDDFDSAVGRLTNSEYADASGQLTNVKIGTLGTAKQAVWNRYILKATGVTWKKPFDAANLGEKFVVTANQPSDNHAQGETGATTGQAKFNAKLRLVKGTKDTAEFENR